jgi:hypothetical protein
LFGGGESHEIGVPGKSIVYRTLGVVEKKNKGVAEGIGVFCGLTRPPPAEEEQACFSDCVLHEFKTSISFSATSAADDYQDPCESWLMYGCAPRKGWEMEIGDGLLGGGC